MKINSLIRNCCWLVLVTLTSASALASANKSAADKHVTPEDLWQLKRVSPLGLNHDGTHVFYKVTIPNIKNNDFDSKVYQVSVNGGLSQLVEN